MGAKFPQDKEGQLEIRREGAQKAGQPWGVGFQGAVTKCLGE